MSDYHSKTFQNLHINSDMSVVCVVFWNDFVCFFFSRMIWIFFLDWFGFVWNDLDLFGRICLKKQMEWFGFVWNDLFFCFAIMCNDVVLWASVSLEFSWMFWTFFFFERCLEVFVFFFWILWVCCGSFSNFQEWQLLNSNPWVMNDISLYTYVHMPRMTWFFWFMRYSIVYVYMHIYIYL